MTSLYLVLARYKLVRFGPCTCLPSIYVQNLPTALLSAMVWRLAFFRPISWLPSFPAILLCHSYRNDSILLGLFRPTIYSFPQWLNMTIDFPTYELLCPFFFFFLSLGYPWPICLFDFFKSFLREFQHMASTLDNNSFIIRPRHQLVFGVDKDWTLDLLYNH